MNSAPADTIYITHTHTHTDSHAHTHTHTHTHTQTHHSKSNELIYRKGWKKASLSCTDQER